MLYMDIMEDVLYHFLLYILVGGNFAAFTRLALQVLDILTKMSDDVERSIMTKFLYTRAVGFSITLYMMEFARRKTKRLALMQMVLFQEPMGTTTL